MEATLKVIVDISEPLERLANGLLDMLGRRQPQFTTVPTPVLLAEPQPEAAPPTEPEAQAEPEKPADPEPEPQAPAAKPELQAPEPPAPQPEAPQEATPPDDETLRTMLDIVITRWAGQGSENSNDPKVLGIRKDVCTAFKQIARHLGAEKPTKLQGEARLKFITEIENNLYNNNGRIEWQAF